MNLYYQSTNDGKETKCEYEFKFEPYSTTTAFVYGFLNSITTIDEFFDNPLSSIFDASIGGSFYSVATNCVSIFVPKDYQFLVPVCLTISSVIKLKKLLD